MPKDSGPPPLPPTHPHPTPQARAETKRVRPRTLAPTPASRKDPCTLVFWVFCDGLVWFAVICYGCYDLLWFVMVSMICYYLLWFVWFGMICYGFYDLLWFAMVSKNPLRSLQPPPPHPPHLFPSKPSSILHQAGPAQDPAAGAALDRFHITNVDWIASSTGMNTNSL